MLQNKDLLPPRGAVYFVLDGSALLYIGQSKNLKNRWRSHHKFCSIEDKKQILISWLECDDPQRTVLERDLIRLHKPFLNGIGVAKRKEPDLKLPENLQKQIQTLAKYEGRSFSQVLLSMIQLGFVQYVSNTKRIEAHLASYASETQQLDNQIHSITNKPTEDNGSTIHNDLGSPR
jgi:hypothetical protein